MSVRSSQSVTTTFTTSVFSTGAAANADTLPTGTLYVNGTADAAAVTVTNVATGLYKAAVTLPTLTVGDVVSIVIAATVGGVAGKGKVWEDTKDVFAGAIPDANAGANGGLPILSAAGTTLGYTVTTVTTNTDMRGTDGAYTGTPPTAAENAAAVIAGIGTGTIAYTGPVNPTTGTMMLTRGDDYSAADGRELSYAVPAGGGNPDLTGATVVASWFLQTVVIGRDTTTALTATLSVACTVTSPGTANQTVTAAPTAAQTALLTGTPYRVCLAATLADGSRVTFARKTCTVIDP